MRKLLGICMVVLALCAFGITIANAAGPWCLTLDGYCDKMEVWRDGNLNLYGHWDAVCDGTFSYLVQGSAVGGVNNVVGYIDAYALSAQYYFNVPARLWDLWGYDGASPPTQYHNDVTFTVSPGTCPRTVEAGLPSSIE